VIAPMTAEAVGDVARALGFTIVSRDGVAFPEGVDAARAAEQRQYALLRGDPAGYHEVVFDGTARECSAFLIGWRDLRSSVLGAVRALDTRVAPEMNASTRCPMRDKKGERCIQRVGHDGWKHASLVYWEGELSQ
jgi:hypothetical protein